MSYLKDAYSGRKVLVTGHTGFKGSWLALWLKELGAEIVGISAYLPSDPCNYDVCRLNECVVHVEADIRNGKRMVEIFDQYKPEVVFHLAGQSIVRRSYEEPKITFDTNLMGTVNVMECIRNTRSVQAGVLITSDKCYENAEWVWGYRETDRLGGKDPYSASKACAEIAARAYFQSYFNGDDRPCLATTRAGNVIGGGDWATDRIVPDCVRAFSSGQDMEVRNPMATRPWQHVLEPLSGYLLLGAKLLERYRGAFGESFNFGPAEDVSRPVGDLVDEIANRWGRGNTCTSMNDHSDRKECTFLKLNCDKASSVLGWRAILSFDQTMEMTVEWYKSYYEKTNDMRAFSIKQIGEYSSIANELGIRWVK